MADARGWLVPAALVGTVAIASWFTGDLADETGALVRFALGLLTVAALLLGARRQQCRPRWAWLVVAAGIAAWVVGDLLWDSLDAHGADPSSGWYNVANLLYLVTYPALFAALLGLVGGTLRGSFENAADSAAFALGAAVLIRMFAVDESFSGNTLESLFNAAWPLGDALLLGGVVWLFFTTGRRNPALWLLAAGTLAMLFSDVAWDLESRYGWGWIDPLMNPAYPVTYALLASAALHPSARRISTQRRANAEYVHRARLGFLCGTLALITVVGLAGNRRDGVLVACVLFLVAVLMVRFAVLVRGTESAYRTAERSERRFRALATAVPVGIMEADRQLRIVFANEESKRQLGGSVLGHTPADLARFISASASDEERAAMKRGVSEVVQGRQVNAQVRIEDASGQERWLAWYAMPAGDGPNSGAFLATVDITALKDAESMLSLQATHDALSGLPNRRLLYDRLSQALAGLERRSGPLAVLFMDLDRFKPVNDEYGHDAGDRLLNVVSGRIQGVVRAGDTVARVGGDEFVVVLTELPPQPIRARAAAGRVARELIEVVGHPVDLDGARASVDASVGIVLCDDPHEDPDRLLRDADAAMYVAKRGSGGRAVFFDEAVGSHQAAQGLVAKRHSVELPAS
ncbi:MAG TPA: sensor domain-containing diguanylate cyclase [Jatrophihabitans sp.]|nr:sensor domain-containing diguanylate cyclase [Jatrophihabitans sp.]